MGPRQRVRVVKCEKVGHLRIRKPGGNSGLENRPRLGQRVAELASAPLTGPHFLTTCSGPLGPGSLDVNRKNYTPPPSPGLKSDLLQLLGLTSQPKFA